MALPKLYIYPLVTAIILPATFFLTYAIAVSLKHTELNWPYISDTGAHPPESCIFGQLINIGAVFLGISFYIRYKQVSEFCSSHQLSSRLRLINYLSLGVGWLGAVGLSIVANFQETEVFVVHMTGAFMAFGFGTVYLWSQVLASILLCPLAHGRCMIVIRLVLAVVNTVAFVVMIVAGVAANKQWHGDDPTKWNKDDGGWTLHVASTGSEWIMALAFDIFILTLVPEFKKLVLESPRICLRVDPSSTLLEINSSFEDYASNSIRS